MKGKRTKNKPEQHSFHSNSWLHIHNGKGGDTCLIIAQTTDSSLLS